MSFLTKFKEEKREKKRKYLPENSLAFKLSQTLAFQHVHKSKCCTKTIQWYSNKVHDNEYLMTKSEIE